MRTQLPHQVAHTDDCRGRIAERVRLKIAVAGDETAAKEMQAYLLLLAALSRTTALHITRRRAINAASAAAASVVLPHAPASAFANAVPEAAKYADRKKRRGPAPQNLGLKNREADGADVETPELRLCGAAPNCFSTTPDSFSAERTIAPWKAPSGKDRAALISDVDAVIKGYQPGQERYRWRRFRGRQSLQGRLLLRPLRVAEEWVYR